MLAGGYSYQQSPPGKFILSGCNIKTLTRNIEQIQSLELVNLIKKFAHVQGHYILSVVASHFKYLFL